MKPDLSAPENFINRDLSRLAFNQRVLEEAEDNSQPLIERVKFLSIFSANLDEFFGDPCRWHQAADRERRHRNRAGPNDGY